jgi:hypothetical protein
MFSVAFNGSPKVNSWCVYFDGIHICRAISKPVAIETARLMNESRADHYRK